MKILITGLPGSGKSTLAKKLVEDLKYLGKPAEWFNADKLREKFNDWDFSEDGRKRQTERMRKLAQDANSMGKIAVCDFVCPTHSLRKLFNADMIIWMDTVASSRYEDTDRLFEDPIYYDYRIEEKNSFPWSKILADKINV